MTQPANPAAAVQEDRPCKGPCQHGQVRPGRYLCGNCWFELMPHIRWLLNRRDEHVLGRIADLHRELAAGIALRHVTVRGINGPREAPC